MIDVRSTLAGGSLRHLALRLRHAIQRTDPDRQRRSHRRVRSNFQVTCLLGDRRFNITAIDLSMTGLRARTPVVLPVGTLVRLEYRRRIGQSYNDVTARVAWSRQPKGRALFEAGLAFVGAVDTLRESWIRPMMRELGVATELADGRAHRRVRTSLRGRLFRPVDAAAEVAPVVCGRIVDLSCGGVLFESPVPVPSGAYVRVAVPVPWSDEAVVCEGQVVRQRRSSRDRCRAAIRFEHVDAERLGTLQDIVDQLLRGDGRAPLFSLSA